MYITLLIYVCSEMTPTTATLLADVIASVGIPAGVFNVVHGVGPRAGQAIVEHRYTPTIIVPS
jgi:aminomuconate-semialdehyde/2-hydroxymuconate-6-semialdehyde dehydrogenase